MPQRCCSKVSHCLRLSCRSDWELTNQVWRSLPWVPMRRSMRAICSAPAKPSSLGSMVRVRIARYSGRPPREPTCRCRGGKLRRQELLGGFEQSRLVFPQDQAEVGALLIEELVCRFVLGMHAVELNCLCLPVQALDEGPGGGDLVGLFVHGLDSQKLLTGLSDSID